MHVKGASNEPNRQPDSARIRQKPPGTVRARREGRLFAVPGALYQRRRLPRNGMPEHRPDMSGMRQPGPDANLLHHLGGLLNVKA
jgi:hypothetical protein